ncbi:MAG: beta-propeller fold lactonase family protein [Nitrospirae bacterium]|nr:beta-propeller fold lactonase family protein [Nitrospirota bacterium]
MPVFVVVLSTTMTSRIVIALAVLILFVSGVHAEEIRLLNVETIPAGAGVKSVVISSDGSKVYCMNLEGMSVYEFDRKSRTLLRKLSFIPHSGKGFDYEKKIWFNSLQEKPVEAHITHDGRFLWVSLHNAGGVVVWDLKENAPFISDMPYKKATIEVYGDNHIVKDVRLPFIETGITPKVITSSKDGLYLFVSNWHSDTVSVIRIDSPEPRDWVKVKDISARIPRGLLSDSKHLYIAEMGNNVISVVELETLTKTSEITVGLNPRHIAFRDGLLYTSLNIESMLAVVDTAKNTMVKTSTCKSPRTIALTGDGKTLFAVCYNSDMLQAFSADGLRPIGKWPSHSHPVGVDVFQDEDLIEVWVANYSSGTLKVFTFKQSPVRHEKPL